MSAFAAAGSALVDNNYSAIPAMPGSKIPGACLFGRWTPMSEWTRFCDRLPTDIETTAWSRWPDAGVGIVLGHGVVAVDIDTDDSSIQAAILRELPELKVGKRGQKGATWF
jgi:Bifunctional DNA primase/polymerase, N-terminal